MLSIGLKNIEDSIGRKVILAELNGKLDMISNSLVGEKIWPVIEGGNIYLLFDLKKLNYIDSAGIYSILQCYTRVKEKKGYLKLARLDENIGEILSSVGVTKIIPTFETLEEALKV